MTWERFESLRDLTRCFADDSKFTITIGELRSLIKSEHLVARYPIAPGKHADIFLDSQAARDLTTWRELFETASDYLDLERRIIQRRETREQARQDQWRVWMGD